MINLSQLLLLIFVDLISWEHREVFVIVISKGLLTYQKLDSARAGKKNVILKNKLLQPTI